MSRSDFVKTTVSGLEPVLFKELKDYLIGDYIPVALLKDEDITCPVLSEIICSYFEKTEYSTGRSFERIIEKYTSDLDSIIGWKIADTPKAKKNKPTPPTPRARKYYEKALLLKTRNKETKRGLLDYTRLMLCLYTAIINNEYKEIEDFDFSLKCLNLPKIIESMLKETNFFGNKAKFKTSGVYTDDRSTFVILIIMFYYMKSKEVVGEF